jgi:uncharacterized lipoprotein YehR (DUF1307 family)
MKKFVAMIMAAVMCCFMLTSCGDSKYAGTWKAEEYGDVMSFTLEKDHSAKIALGFIQSGEDDKIEWEVKDKKIVIKDKSEDKEEELFELDIVDSKTLSMTDGSDKIEFKKQ